MHASLLNLSSYERKQDSDDRLGGYFFLFSYFTYPHLKTASAQKALHPHMLNMQRAHQWIDQCISFVYSLCTHNGDTVSLILHN